jgi:hypothetical protein
VYIYLLDLCNMSHAFRPSWLGNPSIWVR